MVGQAKEREQGEKEDTLECAKERHLPRLGEDAAGSEYYRVKASRQSTLIDACDAGNVWESLE